MNLFSLAVKNLQRRKGRTLLTIAGVAIAVAILFSLLSFSAGYERRDSPARWRTSGSTSSRSPRAARTRQPP